MLFIPGNHAKVETAMASAFLRALADWTARNPDQALTTLPTGKASSAALRRVLAVLGLNSTKRHERKHHHG